METNILSLFIREVTRHRDLFSKSNQKFKLEIDGAKGLGLKAKQDIETDEDIKMLDGDCEDISMSESTWSRVTVNLGDGLEKECLLVGPINFVNHGCEKCANCAITDGYDRISDEIKPYFVMTLRKNGDGTLKKIEKGEELLCDYGEKYGSIQCAACGK